MKVRVLFFATLRDRAGVQEEQIEIAQASTVSALKELISRMHPEVREAMPTTLVSINREYAFPEEKLQEGDEVALFPPVSGGSLESEPTILRITEEPLDLNRLLDELVLPSTGAACVFTGVVRARTERGGPKETTSLEYQAYPGMAHAKLDQVANEIRQHWPSVEGVAIIQRVGHLEPGTPTVLIACTAAHRDSGVFEAARYGIDRLKQIVPIWKKEVGPSGETWVEGDYLPGQSDKQA